MHRPQLYHLILAHILNLSLKHHCTGSLPGVGCVNTRASISNCFNYSKLSRHLSFHSNFTSSLSSLVSGDAMTENPFTNLLYYSANLTKLFTSVTFRGRFQFTIALILARSKSHLLSLAYNCFSLKDYRTILRCCS